MRLRCRGINHTPGISQNRQKRELVRSDAYADNVLVDESQFVALAARLEIARKCWRDWCESQCVDVWCQALAMAAFRGLPPAHAL
jgi:hypothetical protein